MKAVITLLLQMITLGAWFQHIYTCFVEGALLFLVIGAGIIPIGVVNGLGIWFGFW